MLFHMKQYETIKILMSLPFLVVASLAYHMTYAEVVSITAYFVT